MAHWSVCVHTAYSSSTLRNEYRKSWFKFINVHYQFAYQKNSQQIVNITLAVDAERTKKLECSSSSFMKTAESQYSCGIGVTCM